MLIEQDRAEILSGIRGNRTLGSPITLMIKNHDHQNWQGIMESGNVQNGRQVVRPRPGHADLAGGMKYRHHDFRNVLERASARETAARVAAGAICRKLLEAFHISLYSQVLAIGDVVFSSGNQLYTPELQARVDSSPVGCQDQACAQDMMAAIELARAKGESLGGCFEVAAVNVIPGLGSYAQWDRRLDALLAAAVMSIPAIKAVELGNGIEAAQEYGSKVHDEIFFNPERGLYRQQNHAGGVEGGVSNGEEITVKGYMKPIPTLYQPLSSVNISTWQEEKAQVERSDVCAVPSARVVAEAMVAQVLAEQILIKFGGDSMAETIANYQSELEYLEKVWKWKRTLF
jgi:chorismate synthase